jgi:hypothetical protein
MSKKNRHKNGPPSRAKGNFGGELEVRDPIMNKRSLGELRRANKTKQRSPDVTGKLRLQRHTLQAIVRDLKETDGGEVICNIAGWKNQDQHGPYLTVEISPRFVPHERRTPKPSIFDDMFDDE